MTSSAVVNRYANALADVVVSPSAGIDPGKAVEQLRAFDLAVKGSPDLRVVMESPSVSVARKRTVIRRIAEALGLDRIIRNFLLVLTDHRRAASLPEMIEGFEVLVDERLGFVRAEVRSASELTEQEKEKLSARLEALAGGQVRMRFAVDPDLIGGMTARLGSKVYDGSVRGQFTILRHRLGVD
jgi:F-type H+-transporting ATPase subunit delta